MDKQPIFTTAVQGIDARTFLGQFEAIKQRLNEIEKHVKPNEATVLLTRNEVAKMLEISLPTLHNWVKTGILTAYRIGNKVRFKQDEVLNSLQSINHKNTK